MPEGTSAATVVYTAAATDVQGGAVTLQPDAARTRRRSRINGATGVVTINAHPGLRDEVAYSFNVVASDGTLTSTQAVTVAVTDVAPTISSGATASVPEGASRRRRCTRRRRPTCRAAR